MRIIDILFSPYGRATRAQYWRIQTTYLLLIPVAIWLGTLNQDETMTPARMLALAIFLAVCIASIWSSLCAGIKRFHDRGKTGAWLLILLVPLIGAAWYVVEVGFLRGQDGPNRFGIDPSV